MKRILIILAILTSTVYAQTDNDIMLFNDLNTYRTANGDKELQFDTLLYKEGSKMQLHNMVTADSIYHSSVSYEVVHYNSSLPFRGSDEGERFSKFLTKYYNMKYDYDIEIETDEELVSYLIKFALFTFSESAAHNKNMLLNITFGSSAISITDIKINRMPSYMKNTKKTSKIKPQTFYNFKVFVCINFHGVKK